MKPHGTYRLLGGRRSRDAAGPDPTLGTALRQHCTLDPRLRRMLELASERLHLSARGVHRCLRVARTVADLGGCECIDEAALGEALSYRVDAAVTG